MDLKENRRSVRPVVRSERGEPGLYPRELEEAGLQRKVFDSGLFGDSP